MSAPPVRKRAVVVVCGCLLAAFAARSSSQTSPPERPAPGQVRVEVSDGRVSVLSNAAPRLRVLRGLARRTGFAVAAGKLENDRLTLQAVDVELEAAIERVLEGTPYEIRYEFDRSKRTHVLATVVAGELAEPMREIRRLRARKRWEQARRQGVARAALAAALADPDPAVRAGALRRIQLRGAGLRRLDEILARDSAAEVRIAAARQLARGNSASVPPLLTGLADSDPSVVVAVLEALTLVGDASLLAELRPLLEHPHARVRERAARAVRLLQ